MAPDLWWTHFRKTTEAQESWKFNTPPWVPSLSTSFSSAECIHQPRSRKIPYPIPPSLLHKHTHSQVSLQKQSRSCRRGTHNTLHISSLKTGGKIAPKLLGFLFWEAKSLQCHPGTLHPLRACLGLLSYQVICSCRWNFIHEHIHWTVHSSDTIHITYSHQHQSTRLQWALHWKAKGLCKSSMFGSGIWANSLSKWKGISEIKTRFSRAQKNHPLPCALPFLLKYWLFENGKDQWHESTKITEINFQKK